MEALISLECKKQDLLILTVFGNYYFSFCNNSAFVCHVN
jgi:hypothetical protein